MEVPFDQELVEHGDHRRVVQQNRAGAGPAVAAAVQVLLHRVALLRREHARQHDPAPELQMGKGKG